MTDVSDAASVNALAEATMSAFGAVHIVCNNAGVSGMVNRSWTAPTSDWQWVFGVNVWGVIHGIQAFMPILLEQDEGHVVNTGSAACFESLPGMAAYGASKHAVLAISEALQREMLAMQAKVGVTVLIPGGTVNTRIMQSERNWPAALGPDAGARRQPRLAVDQGGLHPRDGGRWRPTDHRRRRSSTRSRPTRSWCATTPTYSASGRSTRPSSAKASHPAGRPRNAYRAGVRRIVCEGYGPPSSLRVVEEPDLEPRAGQVIVDVGAAGVNFVDALFVAGTYQIKIPPPFTPGTELAGTIAALGDGVGGFAVGDRVLATTFGAYASQVALPVTSLSRVPDNLGLDQAAALMQSYCTMWFAFTRRMQLRAGQHVLVLGAGGGIGLAAVDVAASLGATVIAAASSDEKLAAAQAAGATHVVNYTTEDLKVRGKELGVDVVVDPIGGDLADAALRAAGWMSTYIVIGFASGPIPKLPANFVLLNNRTVIGVDWGAWTGRDPAGQAALLDELLTAVADGRLHPPTPTHASLDDAVARVARRARPQARRQDGPYSVASELMRCGRVRARPPTAGLLRASSGSRLRAPRTGTARSRSRR